MLVFGILENEFGFVYDSNFVIFFKFMLLVLFNELIIDVCVIVGKIFDNYNCVVFFVFCK